MLLLIIVIILITIKIIKTMITIINIFRISCNKRRGVYFKLLMARKAFIRERRSLEGGVH